LLVEDEEEVLLLVRRILLATGYQVMEARSAADAIELAQSHSGRPVHLLITDVVLPKMDGPELARQLSETRPEMKVIYISGYDTAKQREAIAPGAAFLQKPFTPENLARKVREVLDAAPAST
jgi:CheY-like chemotaxis protein